MTMTELGVLSQEQTIYLSNGYSANLRFDMIYKRWFFDMYLGDALVYAGIPLVVDTAPLDNICPVVLGLVDCSDDKKDYEPFRELGSRLALMEVVR